MKPCAFPAFGDLVRENPMATKIHLHMKSGNVLSFCCEDFTATRDVTGRLTKIEGTKISPNWLFINLSEIEAITEK